MIIELSKKLLEYTSNIFKTNEHNNNFQKNRNLPKYLPEKSSPFEKKKTLILDLDETLVHSALKPFKTQPDMILTIPFEQNKQTVYVLKRPHVDESLARFPPRVPDSSVVVYIEIASAIVHWYTVVSISCDTAEFCILVEAVSASCL